MLQCERHPADDVVVQTNRAGHSAQRMADRHRQAERRLGRAALPRQIALIAACVAAVYMLTYHGSERLGQHLLDAFRPATASVESPAPTLLEPGARRTMAIAAAVVVGARLLQVAFESRPRRSRSWALGASGERRTGEHLAGLAGAVVLHDRKLPRSSANIDHVVVAPGGVFVVETKQCSAPPEVHRGSLRYKGRNVDRWLGQAQREARAVEVALGPLLDELGVPVRPMLCIQGARVSGRTLVEGVPVVTGRQLRARIDKAPPVLDADHVARLAARLDARLRPAAPPPTGS